ncbi:S66 family peptidase [Konateibacter massiliensis]|uniref:S66 family peptidase n=1 Tax=Konateibacter massiliensis TaxID=2002841 RepID=UPI000C15B456|nr:S66 peptidase family protein [Konateibacter massiliensis]
MRYPRLLKKGDTIGVCAPSSGVAPYLHGVLEHAVKNVEQLGYKVILTDSVRHDEKMVSADAKTRAKEFMELYMNEKVRAIIPPYGGEFLMDMLPHLDFDELSKLEAKWICGYSDITTLLLPLTLVSDIATVHGSSFMNMGFKNIDPSDLFLYNLLSEDKTIQHSSEKYGEFCNYGDETGETYILDKETLVIPIGGSPEGSFSGRMIGGCMDVLCPLIGTRFADTSAFFEKYKNDGFIWALESCNMNSTQLYRAFWQMRQNGWFLHCKGLLIGRPYGYSQQQDFNLADAFRLAFDGMDIPILFGCDIGHIPPQIQLINGSFATVEFKDNKMKIMQEQI